MIEQIKQALEKATPGPWESTGTGVERDTGEPLSRGYVRIANLHGILHSNNPNHENDAHLIANAPEWLRYLIGEVESLKGKLKAKIVLINNGWEEERYVLQNQVEEMQKERAMIFAMITAVNPILAESIQRTLQGGNTHET